MKKALSLFLIIVFVFSYSFSVFADTDTVVSSMSISAGESCYSDTNVSPTSLYIPYGINHSSLHYTKYHVQLHTFKFDSFAQDVKPTSNVRFNFRLVEKTTHTSCADVVYIYVPYGSVSGSTWAGYGHSGQSVAMKSNITNWSSTDCVLACLWYLYIP